MSLASSGAAVPNSTQELFDRAALAFVSGDMPTAMALLQDCLLLEPDLDVALYLLALARLRSGDVVAGREGLERVIAVTQNVMLRDMARSKLAALPNGATAQP